MENEIKELLTESTKGLLSEDVISELVKINSQYVEAQLLESAKAFVEKEKVLNEKAENAETLKEDFIKWLDELSIDLHEKTLKENAVAEINSDVVKFSKMLKEMSYKYNITDEKDEEDDNDDSEDKMSMKKKSKMVKKTEKDEEDDDDDSEDKMDEEKKALKESVSTLLKEKNDLIKKALISEKITQNSNLSEKQKDDLFVICEEHTFDGELESFISFINSNVELVLSGNYEWQSQTKPNSINESEDKTNINKDTEQKEEMIVESEKLTNPHIKKLKVMYKEPSTFNNVQRTSPKQLDPKLLK